MIVTDIKFHPLFQKITIFVGSILLINDISAHKCYVCGPKNADTNAENINYSIPTCDRFNPTSPVFIQECQPHSRGCSIQINGSVVIRACEDVHIVDCKKANNVEYCYCNTEMCNKFHPDPDPQDDEDDFEGSAAEPNFVTNIPNVIQIQTSTSSVQPSSSNAATVHRVNIDTLLSIYIFGFIVFCDKYFIL